MWPNWPQNAMTSSLRRPLIAGNWKMHLALAQSVALAKEVRDGAGQSQAEVALCVPFTAISIVAETLRGSSVGTMSYYGPFSGGGFRHYIGGRYGSDYAPTTLMDLLGGEWGLLKSGGRCWIFNAIRRQGYFR